MLILAGIVLPLLCVGLHSELLVLVSALVDSVAAGRMRLSVALAVILATIAHILEVLVFAAGWYILIEMGTVTLSIPAPTIGDIVYFSGSVYTSLGLGDIIPVGNGRYLVVLEVVTGLVLITWTATFSLYQMREHWMADDSEKPS